MRIRRYARAVSLLLLSLVSAGARPQENGVNAIKTADGFVLVWNDPGVYFTLAVKGRNVRPLNSTEHVFFNVDGVVFQVQTVAVKEFMKDFRDGKPDDATILAAHRDWESKFISESLLGAKLDVKISPLKLADGRDALLWKFDMPEMPEGAQSSAKEQLYLTVVSGDHVILLNGVVEGDVPESAVEKFLLETASTLKASAKPINLRELQESIRKANSQPPARP